MKTRMMAVAVAFAMAAGSTGLLAQSASLGGTAKDEAKRPYTDYTVRARNVQQGTIAGTIALDANGNFTIPNLASNRFLVELVNKDGKVVCTEGPYDMSAMAFKNDVVIDCNKVPAAWWLLGAAAAAGITAGIVAAGPASPAQ
jgi:hypothetical protein